MERKEPFFKDLPDRISKQHTTSSNSSSHKSPPAAATRQDEKHPKWAVSYTKRAHYSMKHNVTTGVEHVHAKDRNHAAAIAGEKHGHLASINGVKRLSEMLTTEDAKLILPNAMKKAEMDQQKKAPVARRKSLAQIINRILGT